MGDEQRVAMGYGQWTVGNGRTGRTTQSSRLIVIVLLLLTTLSFAQTIRQGLQDVVDQLESWVPSVIGIAIVLAALIYAVGQAFGAEMRARATVYATGLMAATLLTAFIYLMLVGFTDPAFIQSVLPGRMGYAIPYIALSMSFGLAMVVLFYLVAAFFQHPPLDAIKQEELAAFLLTIVIVFSWGFLDASMSRVTVDLLCTTTVDLCNNVAAGSSSLSSGPSTAQLTHVDVAYYSLEILFVKLRDIYLSLYVFEVLIGFLSTISFPVGSPLPGLNILSFTFMPFDGLSLLSNAHTIVVEAIGYNMMLILARENLLLFARDAVPTILLPIGLMMRAFPWYRMTGSSLIAICVVAYFVFPLSVLLSNYLIFDVYKPANFVYAPDITSYTTHELTRQEVEDTIEERNREAQAMLEVLQSGSVVAQQAQQACGSGIVGLLCGFEDFLSGTLDAIGGFFSTIGHIFVVMWNFGGDFIDSWLGRITFRGASGGMYNFIMLEVVGVSQFVVVVIFSFILEIIITVTMYRNIASLIGGEIEIAGLSKLV